MALNVKNQLSTNWKVENLSNLSFYLPLNYTFFQVGVAKLVKFWSVKEELGCLHLWCWLELECSSGHVCSLHKEKWVWSWVIVQRCGFHTFFLLAWPQRSPCTSLSSRERKLDASLRTKMRMRERRRDRVHFALHQAFAAMLQKLLLGQQEQKERSAI